MSFIERQLAASFTLVEGPQQAITTFNESGTDTVNIANLRMSARISKAGLWPGMGMTLHIYGMTLSLMNQLSMLGMKYQIVQKSVVVLRAGDAQAGMATVFWGNVTNAYGDFNTAPDVAFVVEAQALAFERVQTVPPINFQASVDIPSVYAGLAAAMGKGFVNYGVTGKLANVYLSGTAGQQFNQFRKWTRFICEATVDETGSPTPSVVIWPAGQSMNQSQGIIPVIQPPPNGNMIGYPTYTETGVVVRTLYDPNIKVGGLVQVQGSQLTAANKQWNVYGLDHALDSLVPHGEWSTTLLGSVPGYPAPPPS
jgi:hypothetical protein